MGNYYPGGAAARATGHSGVVSISSAPRYRPIPEPIPLGGAQIIEFPAHRARVLTRAVQRFIRGWPGQVLQTIILVEELREGRPAYQEWVVPEAWAGALEYICPSPGGPASGGSSGITYAMTPGVSGDNCLGGQAVYVAPGERTNLRIGYWYLQDQDLGRWSHVRSYVRNWGQFEDPYPYHIDHPAVEPRPAVYGRIDLFPYTWPDFGLVHGQQMLGQMMIPYAMIPYMRPFMPGDVGPLPEKTPVARPSPVSAPEGFPQPVFIGSTSPSTKPFPAAGGLPRPPRAGTKERKQVLAIRGAVAFVFNGVTESLDALNCAHSALPKSLQKKPRYDPTRYNGQGGYRRATPQEIAAQVYKHFDQVDVAALMSCLVQNHFEDMAIGKLGKITAKANRKRGNFAGLAFGPAL